MQHKQANKQTHKQTETNTKTTQTAQNNNTTNNTHRHKEQVKSKQNKTSEGERAFIHLAQLLLQQQLLLDHLLEALVLRFRTPYLPRSDVGPLVFGGLIKSSFLKALGIVAGSTRSSSSLHFSKRFQVAAHAWNSDSTLQDTMWSIKAPFLAYQIHVNLWPVRFRRRLPSTRGVSRANACTVSEGTNNSAWQLGGVGRPF